MKNIFSEATLFIKSNLIIVYTLFLLVLIPAAFLINNYLVNSSYESNIDQITRKKAVLVESVINNLMLGRFDDEGFLQSSVARITEKNSEIVSLSVLKPGQEGFEIIASSDTGLIGQAPQDQTQNNLAWINPEGIASLEKNSQGRYWKVTKTLLDGSGKRTGLIEMSLSLSDSDALISRTAANAVWIVLLTILVVVLLVANQTRLMSYAWKVTKLQEVDKMKDVFMSMASHELRSPLTAIKGYLDLIKSEKDLVLSANVSHYLDNIFISAKRLDNLVEDILEVSRIEGNQLPMQFAVFNPNEVISQCAEELKSQALQKGLALNCRFDEQPISIKSDASRLKQVLINLIGNAIKYTKKGKVEVGTRVANNKLLITVADTGLGISAEEQQKIFQKFYRIRNRETADIIGTGLGLWIAMEIAKKLGGKITVESISGVGSHFTIILPIAD